MDFFVCMIVVLADLWIFAKEKCVNTHIYAYEKKKYSGRSIIL